MTNNIKDITHSAKDWEDFWCGDEETMIQELMKPDPNKVSNAYVKDVIEGKNMICKRESPLSD